MQKLEADELEKVAGGLSVPNTMSDPAMTRVQSGLASKENAASIAGMGMEKNGALLQGDMGGRTARAYCPVCKKETVFRISSGARALCSVCGNVRLDL